MEVHPGLGVGGLGLGLGHHLMLLLLLLLWEEGEERFEGVGGGGGHAREADFVQRQGDTSTRMKHMFTVYKGGGGRRQ